MLQEVCGVERQFQEHEEGGLMHSIRNLVNLVNRRSMSASKKDSGSLFFFFVFDISRRSCINKDVWSGGWERRPQCTIAPLRVDVTMKAVTLPILKVATRYYWVVKIYAVANKRPSLKADNFVRR